MIAVTMGLEIIEFKVQHSFSKGDTRVEELKCLSP